MKPVALSISLLVLLSLTGCASGPAQPPRMAQGIAENQRGLAMLAKGEDTKALEHFQRALQIAESIEDQAAMATNLLNIARTQRRLGQTAAASATLERLMADQNRAFARQYRIDAAYEAATLALEAQNNQAAWRALQQAETWCQSGCTQRGQLLTLSAHLRLNQGDSTTALKDARFAVRILRQDNPPGSPSEQSSEHLANALRTQALALIAEHQPGPAIALLNEALELDKRRAASKAIYKDLLVLGQAYQAKGQPLSARDYFRRALAVARADNHPVGIAQASAALAQTQ